MTGRSLSDRVHDRLLDVADDVRDRSQVRELVRAEAPLVDGARADEAVDEVMARIDGLGPIEPLLADGSVTEIMVNGDGTVWAERRGELRCEEARLSHDQTRLVIERIVDPLGLRVDRSSPMVDARLPDGSRVNAVLPPLAVDGPTLTVRRFSTRPIPLVAFGNGEVVARLRAAVRDRANVVVSGGSGAGKTTLLNALGSEVPTGERVVSVEDAAELRLPGDHVVRLESRPANADGQGEVTIRSLVRNALRMRPDRIVVGEVRGAEAFDLVQACNTGHRGTLSTCHANSPLDALRRIETLAMMAEVGLPLEAVREQVQAGIDLVVQVARHADGERRVTAIGEVRRDGPERLRVSIVGPPPDGDDGQGTAVAGAGAAQPPARPLGPSGGLS